MGYAKAVMIEAYTSCFAITQAVWWYANNSNHKLNILMSDDFLNTVLEAKYVYLWPVTVNAGASWLAGHEEEIWWISSTKISRSIEL